jgi:CspA family cold shock protein
MKGTIVRLMSDKGYGFIKGEDGAEYFFHMSALITYDFKDLLLNNEVEFRPANSPKGPRAEEIEIVE